MTIPPFADDDIDRFTDWGDGVAKVTLPSQPTGAMTAEQFQDWWALVELAGTDVRRLETVRRQIEQLPASPRRTDLLATIEQILAEL